MRRFLTSRELADRLGLVAVALAAVLALGTGARAATKDVAECRLALRQDDDPKPPQHVHQWTRQSRKEWVPPVTKQVQVGTDSHGKPIYQTQIVKPGYWRTITYFACACGAIRS